MQRITEAVRPELIERLQEAARNERAQTLRRLMRTLLGRERDQCSPRPTPIAAVTGDRP